MTYARFTARFVALLIDWALLGVVFVVVAFLGVKRQVWGGGLGPFPVVAPWIYYALQESAGGATLGKLALGLRVVGPGGGRLSFARATGRYFAKWLSAIPFGLGFLMAAFTAKKQALHDILAGTCVVETSSSGSSAEAGPYARWQR